MSEQVCVCGHIMSDHFQNILGNPCDAEECWKDGVSRCDLFRPVLSWPDSEGYWWMQCEDGLKTLVTVRSRMQSKPPTDDFVVSFHYPDNYWGVSWQVVEQVTAEHGPAKFTKLLEAPPWTKER